MSEEPTRRTRAVGVAVAAITVAGLIAGCGGNGGDDPPSVEVGGDVAAVLHIDGERTIAYETEQGTRLWEVDGFPVARQWASNGRFLVNTLDALEQRDSSTGELRWSAELLHGLSQVAVIDDQILVIGDGDVEALDFETGQPMWSWSGAEQSSFLFGGGRVVVEDADRRIVALDSNSGRELWRSDAEVDLRLDVKFGRSLEFPSLGFNEGFPAYVLTEDAMFLYEDQRDDHRDLVVLDGSTGEENWRIAGIDHFGVAMVDDTMVVAADEGIVAFDWVTGEERWSIERLVRSATLHGNTIVAADGEKVFGVDAVAGVLQWERLLDVQAVGSAGSVVIAHSSERTYAVNPSSGETIWEAPVSGERRGLFLAREPGTITDGVLLAVERFGDEDLGTIEFHLIGIDVGSGETMWVQTP